MSVSLRRLLGFTLKYVLRFAALFCRCLSFSVLQTRVYARLVANPRCLDIGGGLALFRLLFSSSQLPKTCKWLKLGKDDSVRDSSYARSSHVSIATQQQIENLFPRKSSQDSAPIDNMDRYASTYFPIVIRAVYEEIDNSTGTCRVAHRP